VYGQDYPDASLVQKSRDIAIAYGYPCVEAVNAIAAFPGPRSLMAYAAMALGIPGIISEVGGAGWGLELESAWLAENVKGTRNVMRHLGILNEPLVRPEKILYCDRTIRVNPTVGGLIIPEHQPDTLLREVRKGELLAQVVSPYTLDTIERLESPCDGWLFYMCRSYPVRPGNWGFGVLPKTNARWETL
jgi:predicted deacylase